jgi:hypothetical protein
VTHTAAITGIEWGTFWIAAATLAVAVAALLIGWGQLRKINKTSGAEALKLVLSPLDDPDIRRTRYLVLRDDFPSGLPLPEEFHGVRDMRNRIRRLGYAYDTLAIFVTKDLIDEKIVYEIHGQSVLIVWKKLEAFLLGERKRREGYARYFEALASRWEESPPRGVWREQALPAAKKPS